MSIQTDKRLVREAAQLTLDTLGNLFESHRHKNVNNGGRPLPRSQFCKTYKLNERTVSQIERGKVWNFDDTELRLYLAASYGSNGARFSDSAKAVYDGIREIDRLLKML